MQVSWIDPEDVASLAEGLRRPPPRPASPPSSGHTVSLLEESETLPASDPVVPETAPAAADVTSEEIAAEEPLPAPATPIAEAAPAVTSPDLEALRQRLQEIRARAMDAGLLPSAQAVAKAPESQPITAEDLPPPPSAPLPNPVPFQVPLGSVMARLEAFASWTHQTLGDADVFVVDDHDDLLWGPQEQAGLVLSSLMALSAAARSSALSACENGHVSHHQLPTGRVLTVIPCGTRLGVMQVAVAALEALAPTQTEALCSALISAMDAQEESELDSPGIAVSYDRHSNS